MSLNDTSLLNNERLKLINKGFLTSKDIQRFVPCGRRKGKELEAKIKMIAFSSGKEISMFGYPPELVMEVLHLTETKIRKYAEDENKRLESEKKNG